MIGDAQLGHRVGELGAPVLTEPVLLIGGQMGQLGHQDLAHLPRGAGDQRDGGTFGDVFRHRGALVDGLVIGMGVHQEQPAGR